MHEPRECAGGRREYQDGVATRRSRVGSDIHPDGDAATWQFADVAREADVWREPCGKRHQTPASAGASEESRLVLRVQIAAARLKECSNVSLECHQFGRRSPDGRGVPSEAE
jgi:hypothetical protein